MEAEPGISCFTCEYYDQNCQHKQPKIIEENEDVFDIIYFSPSIWKRDFNGTVGFDWSEVLDIMKILTVRSDSLLIMLLKKAEGLLLEHIRKEHGA